MQNFNAEMLEKAKTVNSAEALLALAKENDIEMTEDEATTYFSQLNPKSGELDDEDLDSVSGGACSSNSADYAHEGDRVRVINGRTCAVCGGTIGYVETDLLRDEDMVVCENKACNCCIAHNISMQLGVDVELA